MLKDRVHAGIKLFGFYYLLLTVERLITLGSSLLFLRDESKQFNTYLGAPTTSLTQFVANRQVMTNVVFLILFLVVALLCLRRTSAITRMCLGKDQGEG